jgi:peptidoglycan/xylan/chitin deacetylase (PgdA/CDA1 family)
MVKDIISEGHEIGSHGYRHEQPPRDFKNIEEERNIFEKSISILKDLTGKRPVGYRSPAWEFSPWTLKLLHEMKYLWSSNYMNTEMPFIHKIDGKKSGLVEIPCDWTLDDAPQFFVNVEPWMGFGIANPSKVLEIWTEEFEGMYEDGHCYCPVVHPQIIGRPNRIRMFEKWIQHMKSHANVWFATGSEVAKYWLESEGTREP